jgi:5-methylcytosine-specific restriction endonuclease McrA
MTNSKACTECQQIKPLTEFHIRKDAKDGHRNKCKNCFKAINAKWRNNNQIQKKQSAALWYVKNKNHAVNQAQKWQKNNRDKKRQHNKNWRKNNHNKIIEFAKKWRLANPEKVREAEHRRRAFKNNTQTKFVSKKEILSLYLANCFYCSKPLAGTVDHIVPLSRGGRHSIGNLISACVSCNSKKGTKTIMEWKLSLLKKEGATK